MNERIEAYIAKLVELYAHRRTVNTRGKKAPDDNKGMAILWSAHLAWGRLTETEKKEAKQAFLERYLRK